MKREGRKTSKETCQVDATDDLPEMTTIVGSFKTDHLRSNGVAQNQTSSTKNMLAKCRQ